jgi:polysaccharide biosynthesis protein PslH
MKVLQICHKPPFPPIDGGCLAMDDISNGLIRKGCEVKILTLSTQKHPFLKNRLTDNYLRTTKIEAVDISTDINPKDALVNLFTKKSYNITRFFSLEFENKIRTTLQQNVFDIIQLESLFVVPYLSVVRKYSNSKIVYRAHNIEQQIWLEKYNQESNLLKKSYLKLLYNRLKNFEDVHLSQFDGIAAISEKDIDSMSVLGNKKPTVHIPFSINPTRYYPLSAADNSNLFFIGSLDWKPNVDGLDWFLDKCWPQLKANNNSITFHIAGKSTPEKYNLLNDPQIKIHGEVDNAMDFIREQGIMIVPLFSGSGIRIKVVEGLALGKAIVATTKAIEGIPVTPKELIVADTAESFIKNVELLIGDENKRKLVGINARKFVKENFDNDVITQNLINFYHTL